MARARLALVCIAMAWLGHRPVAAQSVGLDPEAPMPGDADQAFARSDEKKFSAVWIPPYAFGSYLGGASVRLEPETRERDGIDSASAVVWGFMATLWRFAHVDAGVGLATAEDRDGFCSEGDSGTCWTTESEVTGFLGWVKLGPQLRLLVPIEGDAIDVALRASLGAQTWGLTRSAIDECSDCAEQSIGLGGVYVSPEIDLAYAWGSEQRANGVGLKFSYERFVTGDLIDGLRLSLLVESYF